MSRYEHDCSDCVFLGEHEDYDLYVCERNPVAAERSVIARFGSAGDYLSMRARYLAMVPDVTMPGDVALVEALRRAQARGLVTTRQ